MSPFILNEYNILNLVVKMGENDKKAILVLRRDGDFKSKGIKVKVS
jgi:hypothetical protein